MLNLMEDDSGTLDGQNRAKIRQIEAKRANEFRFLFDLSATIPIVSPGVSYKVGFSFVSDLVHENTEVYLHSGAYVTDNSGASVSVGVVNNYLKSRAYEGPFFDWFIGSFISYEYCCAIEETYQKANYTPVEANSFSITVNPYSSIASWLTPTAGIGLENYWYLFSLDLFGG